MYCMEPSEIHPIILCLKQGECGFDMGAAQEQGRGVKTRTNTHINRNQTNSVMPIGPRVTAARQYKAQMRSMWLKTHPGRAYTRFYVEILNVCLSKPAC